MISSTSGAFASSALSYLQSLTGADNTTSTTGTNGTESSSSTSFDSQLFSKMDTNGDGAVTKTEFTDAIQSLVSQMLSQMQQSLSSGAADNSTSGATDADEGFTAKQLTQMASSTSGTDSSASTLFSALANNFTAADADGNGKVSRNEAMTYRDTYLSSESGGSTLSIAA